MTFLLWMGGIVLVGLVTTVTFFRKGGIYNPKLPPEQLETNQKIDSPSIPSAWVVEPISAPTALLWDTPKHCWHSVRVICDEMELTMEEKNLICACIYQESRFNNAAIGRNKDKKGTLLSTDWGIVQVNDYWNIGKDKPFPSVEWVVNNPEEMVRWMVECYKNQELYLWASYSQGSYAQWIKPTSEMWLLKV